MNKFLLLVSLIIAPCVQAKSFQAEHWQTSNGARVVFSQAKEVPMLDFHIAFPAGSAYDGNQFGLNLLTARLLNQGSTNLNANQIAEKMADLGAQYQFDTNRDMAVFSLRTLSDEATLTQAVALFSSIVTQPSFKPDSFYRERNQQLDGIKQNQESPDDVANQLFYSNLYKNHPYSHPIDGTLESVKNLTPRQIQEFYKRYYTANNAVIVLVGAISSEQAHLFAEQLASHLRTGEPVPAIPQALPLTEAASITIPFPSSQTMIRLGQIGIDHSNPHYFPLLVGNYILGGGTMVSRLAEEVREKRGLSYGVYSQFLPMPAEGPFLISLATKNTQMQQALETTQTTLKQFLETGPTETELNAAKHYLIGSFPMSTSSNNQIAGMLLKIAFYHLPENYLEKYTSNIQLVSEEDIKQAFKAVIHPENMLQVTVGKA